MDPQTPVIVGAAQLSGRDGNNEPIEMMTTVASAALSQAPVPVSALRVVKGVWPYANPAALLADRLGIRATTGLTQLGGNESLDLFNQTAHDIASGHLDAAVLSSAETMRTRRTDRKAGRRSPYLAEADETGPREVFGSEVQLWEQADLDSWGAEAVNFYAMAASAVRHRLGRTPEQYLAETSTLWADASAVAVTNPHAWLRDGVTAETVATPTPDNRPVAAPFTKLMTSNINVDQAAAVVMCSAAVARSAGIDRSQWVFPLAGTGAHDPRLANTRAAFDQSPSMRIAGAKVLELSGLSLDDIELIDLYSCFPSAVQVGQHELGLDPARQFTITGGMTFGGGPFGSYCMHSLARAVELLQNGATTALISGNGGWFSKHAYSVLAADAPAIPFRYERPQGLVDAEPVRETMTENPRVGRIDAYTVTYDRSGGPDRAIMAVADSVGARAWATSIEPHTIDALCSTDSVGSHVHLDGELPVLAAAL